MEKITYRSESFHPVYPIRPIRANAWEKANIGVTFGRRWAAYVPFPRPDRKEAGLGLSQHVHLFRPVALPLRLRKHSSEREAISCRQTASRFGAPHVHPAPHRHSPVGIKWQMVNPFRTGSVTTGGTYSEEEWDAQVSQRCPCWWAL